MYYKPILVTYNQDNTKNSLKRRDNGDTYRTHATEHKKLRENRKKTGAFSQQCGLSSAVDRLLRRRQEIQAESEEVGVCKFTGKRFERYNR